MRIEWKQNGKERLPSRGGGGLAEGQWRSLRSDDRCLPEVTGHCIEREQKHHREHKIIQFLEDTRVT